MNESYTLQDIAEILAAAVRPPPGWRSAGHDLAGYLGAHPRLLDDVRINGAQGNYRAVIVNSDTPSGTFTVGSFITREIALSNAGWHVLDQQGIPHVNSERSLKLSELRLFSGEDLRQRERVIKNRKGNKAQAERRNIHRVVNERCKAADGMIDRAKQAQAQLVKEQIA